ncbi:type IV pilin [Methanoregula sp.]|jgi:FlaG/FlaF family flagellin (archaellin)|uniref:type IV pilin n=1 Tax=Methanoregula sp. TaxID=2052170 RepID=UPI00356641CD
MQKNARNYDAVSPVVGVMLMLVVTIIIAAVVSAFSGGVAQSTPKAPQISLGAEAHNNTYIILDHKGGDTISGSSITIKTYIPSGKYKDMSYQVNLSSVIYLPDNKPLYDYDPATYEGRGWATIQPGDKLKINWADAFKVTKYGPMAPSVGEPVDIEIYDSASGKEIATTRVTVMP